MTRPPQPQGTRASRKLRRSGWIPSILYGGSGFGSQQLLQVETKALNKELRELKGSFNDTLYDLHVGEKTYSVLVIISHTYIRYQGEREEQTVFVDI